MLERLIAAVAGALFNALLRPEVLDWMWAKARQPDTLVDAAPHPQLQQELTHALDEAIRSGDVPPPDVDLRGRR